MVPTRKGHTNKERLEIWQGLGNLRLRASAVGNCYHCRLKSLSLRLSHGKNDDIELELHVCKNYSCETRCPVTWRILGLTLVLINGVWH